MEEKADSSSKERDKRPRKMGNKKRKDNLLLATDSAIHRLKSLAQPGGDVEKMDIKDLKNFISSIKELSGISSDLNDSTLSGVVVLPEVKIDEQ
jgi:hypothetical protein